VRLTEKLTEEANRKWPTENRITTWSLTSHDHERYRSWLLRAQYLENNRRCYLATIANSLLWGSTIGYPSDSLASCLMWSCCWSCEFLSALVATSCMLMTLQWLAMDWSWCSTALWHNDAMISVHEAVKTHAYGRLTGRYTTRAAASAGNLGGNGVHLGETVRCAGYCVSESELPGREWVSEHISTIRLYSTIHVGTHWKIQDRRQIKNLHYKTKDNQWKSNQHKTTLEIWGRAQHEAARRPKSNWKYNLRG